MKFSSSFFAILVVAVTLTEASDYYGDHHGIRQSGRRHVTRSQPKTSLVISPVDGMIAVPSTCGPTGATKNVTQYSGPNGNIDWLNCGINEGGWKPPFMTVQDIVTVDLTDAIKDPNSPFKACTEYVPLLEKYSKENGLPPILMAAFAMQESSCNPNTIGGGGEQGIMQITPDKCTEAPNGNCLDVDYNIRIGAEYFARTLKANGGDLALTIGMWNGWFPSMTFGQATAARWSNCCRCQKNVDYLHQFLNGWCQNIDSYDYKPRLGKYFNLDVCS